MSEEPARFAADGYARERVPDAQLHGASRVFFIVTGALCGLPVFVLATQLSIALGISKSRVAFVVGGAISGSLGALSVYSGARTRMNLAMLAERAFGRWGGQAIKCILAFCLLGWFVVILSVLGKAASPAIGVIFHRDVPEWSIAGAAGLAVSVIALRGISGLEAVGMIIGPLLMALLAWTLHIACPTAGWGVRTTPVPLDFGAAVSAVVGMYIVGIVVQPDYGRYVRKPFNAAAASGLALALAYPCILIFSSMPAAKCGAPDLISVMIASGIGFPALVLLFLGAWIDGSVSLYSGSLSLTNQIKPFRLPCVIVVSGAIGCLFASLHAERYLMPFLVTLGIALPPIATVQVLEVLTTPIDSQRASEDHQLPAIRWPSWFAWTAGIAAGYGGQSGRLPTTGIASVDSVAASCLILLLAKWCASRGRSLAPE